MPNSPQSINIAFTTTSSATFVAPTQQVTVTDFSNRSYLRQMFVTQNGVKLVSPQGQVVQIPLQQLFAAGSAYNPLLTWPPIITLQPSSSNNTVPSTSSFTIQTSSEIPVAYQWYSGSSASGSWGALTDHSFSGNTISGSTANIIYLEAADTLSFAKFYECIASNASGGVTSSIIQLTL